MESASSVEFAQAACAITRIARQRGLVAPSYRSPPRLVGADRTIRRRPDTSVIAVRVRGRPLAAVQADMVEGVVVANGLHSPHADRLRADLWDALGATTGTSTTRARGTAPATRPASGEHAA